MWPYSTRQSRPKQWRRMEDRRRTVVARAAILRDAGLPFPDLIVSDANHEHGIIAVRPRSSDTLPDLAIDDRVRILPTHA